jgi:hypothetical protein
MQTLKFKNILKYVVSKTILTSILVVISSAFNGEGEQQMIGFTLVVGILSLAMLCLFLLKRKLGSTSSYFPFFMVFFALIVNDVVGMALEMNTNIISVLLQ